MLALTRARGTWYITVQSPKPGHKESVKLISTCKNQSTEISPLRTSITDRPKTTDYKITDAIKKETKLSPPTLINPIINNGILQIKNDFIAQGKNDTETKGLAHIYEATRSPIKKLIDDAVDKGLEIMARDIQAKKLDSEGMRQVIIGFLGEIYSREKDSFGGECKNKEIRDEFFREIGELARDAKMDSENKNGVLVPSIAGSNPYHAVVYNSYKHLEGQKDVSPWLQSMKPEIRERVQSKGSELITPIVKEFGFPTPAEFQGKITETASLYRERLNDSAPISTRL
ncbi:hypothetical protein RBU55_18625 [Pseudomonas chlororaphis subsp. aurantiaca]|uniref:hypothetical protein n=1 Tax=Pseudomonas chlororaphis TaxID=587753 RepID=UPI0027DC622E|nr:hypothetical protein [Pseudomonas chlororaphis]WMI97580.1 hypothetical protein RBU55_18625 [Pseudomonas chlororaphis subsp. aurantiaca]